MFRQAKLGIFFSNFELTNAGAIFPKIQPATTCWLEFT